MVGYKIVMALLVSVSSFSATSDFFEIKKHSLLLPPHSSDTNGVYRATLFHDHREKKACKRGLVLDGLFFQHLNDNVDIIISLKKNHSPLLTIKKIEQHNCFSCETLKACCYGWYYIFSGLFCQKKKQN